MIFVIMMYIKKVMLYHPIKENRNKYDRFFHKLMRLAEPKNIINSMVKTSDNILLDTIYIKNPDATKYILFFHGGTGNISMRFDMIKFLYNYASVIVFDYRSYGRSTGSSNNLSYNYLQRDADAIWNFVTTKLNISPKDISLFGESIGCSFAIKIASEMSQKMDSNFYPHSLILNSPIYSLSSLVQLNFNKINIKFVGRIVSIFMNNEYKSNEWIKYVNHKTTIIIAHSPRDEVIPYVQGVNLYHSISETRNKIKFININGTHNNLVLSDDYIYTLAGMFQG